MTKVSTYLDYTNTKDFSEGNILITKHGGMLLPSNYSETKGFQLKNRGNIYLLFDCHIKSRYGLDKIDYLQNNTLQFVDYKKENLYNIGRFELTLFLNSLLYKDEKSSTICLSTGNGYVQWFRKSIELEVNNWIEKNILKT